MKKIHLDRPLGRDDRHDGNVIRRGEVQLRLPPGPLAIRNDNAQGEGLGAGREGGRKMTDLVYLLLQTATFIAVFTVALAAN